MPLTLPKAGTAQNLALSPYAFFTGVMQSMLSLFNHARAAILIMIATFRHKGLRRFFQSGVTAGIQPSHAGRLKMLLAALDTALLPTDMDLPGFRFHSLRNTQPQRWSLHVNANWRLTFAFEGGHAQMVDYEDYH